MNKEIEIKKILTALAENKDLRTKLSDSKINEISKSLSLLFFTTRDTVKSKISGSDIILKESIDFSDTNYWIDMIVDIINKN